MATASSTEIHIASWNDLDRSVVVYWGKSAYEYFIDHDKYRDIKEKAIELAEHSEGTAANYIKRRAIPGQTRKISNNR
jgi:hypothetical protein